MSHIGIGNNLHTPSRQCLTCKRWVRAGRVDKNLGVGEAGRCSLGYCEKTRKKGKVR